VFSILANDKSTQFVRIYTTYDAYQPGTPTEKPITDALDIVKWVVKNSLIADSIARSRENLAEGGDIASVLKGRGVFPPIAVHMIAIGEKGGRLEEMLLNVANAFDREVERVAEGLTSILEPLLILAMGGIVFFIALSILLPIFEMNRLVG